MCVCLGEGTGGAACKVQLDPWYLNSWRSMEIIGAVGVPRWVTFLTFGLTPRRWSIGCKARQGVAESKSSIRTYWTYEDSMQTPGCTNHDGAQGK